MTLHAIPLNFLYMSKILFYFLSLYCLFRKAGTRSVYGYARLTQGTTAFILLTVLTL
jgi:hypothetical protein